jgi:structural maintenance of chromosome 4
VEEAKIPDDREEEEGRDDDDEDGGGEIDENGGVGQEGELSDDEDGERERSASLDDDDTAPLHRDAAAPARQRRRSPENKEKATKKKAPPAPAPLSAEELAALDASHLSLQLQRLQQQLDASVPDLAALATHSRASKDASRKARELEKVTERRNAARQNHDALRKKRLDEFMSGFAAISSRLKEMYRLITLGGDAELELVDSLDPFAEGVVFSVRPPKKAWKNISNLSGGEKTLSSLALVFALHHFKPTPLYVMDEIDAALDFRNVSIVAHYIKERVTKGAQFVIISLRNDMFELADRLVGIYKTHDATKSVAVDPRDYACAGAPLPLTASSNVGNAQQSALPAPANAVGGEVHPRAAVA